MEASSPSRSDSFSRGGWYSRCKPLSFEPLDVVDAAPALGESFSSSTTASFIDMDPEELFSMRWTTSEEDGFNFGLPPPASGACACSSSPLLATSAAAGLVIFSDDSSLLLPCEAGGARDDVTGGGGSLYGADASSSACSSPAAFHTAHSTPASVIISSASSRRRPGANKPLLATRRILLRYLRFLVPLCRKARALRLPVPVPAPGRVFSAPRSCRAAAATPARRSTSSASSGSAAEYWCHGNADVDVRDAILHCKKSLLPARTEC